MEMLEPQSSLPTTTEKVKHQLIELFVWLEEPKIKDVIKLLIEDSEQCITLLNELNKGLQEKLLTNPMVVINK